MVKTGDDIIRLETATVDVVEFGWRGGVTLRERR